MSAEISGSANHEKCSAILLDVAGTTTSIDFLKNTLFKYATDNVEEFLKEKWDESSVKDAVKELKDGELDVAAAIELVKELTDKNSTNKGLKALQGMLYEKAYTSGTIKAHVFDDVPSCLEAWAKTRKVAIYSSGSVDAQKLLFAHTTEGDLTAHITKYFDQTVVGGKTEKASYEKIVKELEVAPETVLFLSDDVEEIKAAKSAGLLVVVVEREGNAALADEVKTEYTVVTTFKDVSFENPAKRKIEDEPATSEEPPTKVAKTETDEEKTEDTAAEKPAEAAEETTMEVDTAVATETETDKKEPEVDQKTEETPAPEKTETTEPTNEAMETTEETKEETATENGEAKPETETTEAEKPTEETEKKEEKAEEKKESAEEKPAEEQKTEEVTESKTAEEETDAPAKTVEKPETEESVEKAEEAKVEEEKKAEVDVAEEAKEAEEKPESNGTVENGKHEDEKENNAELANGIENGKAEKAEENGEELTKTDDSEIKVKKLDDPVESTPVAVEV